MDSLEKKMIHGISPVVTNSTHQGNSNVAPLGGVSEVTRDRMVVREAFPTSSMFQDKRVLGNQWAQTPFRIVMNAGDLLSRRSAPGGSNQIKGSVGRNEPAFMSDGVQKGDGASGNARYVYDSSVYTKFKRLSAKTATYNKATFGGSNNSAYVSIKAAGRFLL
jgi:hypothetical protein